LVVFITRTRLFDIFTSPTREGSNSVEFFERGRKGPSKGQKGPSKRSKGKVIIIGRTVFKFEAKNFKQWKLFNLYRV
jgi:hypothetical protein